MVRRVDPDELDPEAAERVERDVEGEEARRPRVEAPLDRRRRAGRRRSRFQSDLVEEGRVVGRLVDRRERPVRRVDLEAPRQVGRLPEELLVPPVADPPDRLRHEQPGREAVGEEPDVRAGALRDEAADEAAGGDPAPDAEAALPDRERPPPLVGHLVPARREVVEPRADDARRRRPRRRSGRSGPSHRRG